MKKNNDNVEKEIIFEANNKVDNTLQGFFEHQWQCYQPRKDSPFYNAKIIGYYGYEVETLKQIQEKFGKENKMVANIFDEKYVAFPETSHYNDKTFLYFYEECTLLKYNLLKPKHINE